ncbi:glucosamine--fructose-6-phosphate aminotransferase (isomerizing) [Rubricella aquisinus]|uniref:Glucosamine--fructose-6-phosphate aminotransferase (Isomerizing) n=1 Tax=Rubricella aquisinus TaxID=2028108 RepID=A0A840X703_9RHOB|nr:SIS domain-containing protein [Rubricella aquisinus]MBB5516487.1 glucosamine--fructose-6-phosphate aminotransferase (isomerizing) [Rubricella aquisinus]
MTDTSLMAAEIAEIAPAVQHCLTRNEGAMAALGEMLRRDAPGHVITVARGSSDHAAHYVGQAISQRLGLAVASVGPSISSVYGARIAAEGALVLAVSQSGQSRDIRHLTEMLGDTGGLTVALTNRADSPLAHGVDHMIDIAAGPEQAVAATKSYVCSVVAGLMLVAHWAQDGALQAALQRLPDALDGALRLDWSAMAAHLEGAERMTLLSRGAGLSVAQEMALKLMETCGIAAQAFSAAEVLHGPSALLRDGARVMLYATEKTGAASIVDTGARLTAQGADVLAMPPQLPALHPLLDPIAHLPAFYKVVEQEARRRGINPDRPAFLQKETDTL